MFGMAEGVLFADKLLPRTKGNATYVVHFCGFFRHRLRSGIPLVSHFPFLSLYPFPLLAPTIIS